MGAVLALLSRTFVAGAAAFGLLVAYAGPAKTNTNLVIWGVGFILVTFRLIVEWAVDRWKARKALRRALRGAAWTPHDGSVAVSTPVGTQATS